MKKIIAIILLAAVALTAVWFFVLRDTDNKKTVETESKAEVAESEEISDVKVYPQVLEDEKTYDIKKLEGTMWQLSGGRQNGVEMPDSQINSIVKALGGAVTFSFKKDLQVTMAKGVNKFEGGYSLIKNNKAIYAAFKDFNYYGVISKDKKGKDIMIFVDILDKETELIFTSMQ